MWSLHQAEIKYHVFTHHTKMSWNLITAAYKVTVTERKNVIFQYCSSMLRYSKKLPLWPCTSLDLSQKFSRQKTMPAREGKECLSIVFSSSFQHLCRIKSKYTETGMRPVCNTWVKTQNNAMWKEIDIYYLWWQKAV